MSSESQEFQLDEVCEFINGFAFKPENYVEKSADTYEVFRMGYINRGGGFKEDSSPVFVSRSNPKLEKFRLCKGDIIIAMTDMKDKVAILANTARVAHDNRFVLNQRAGLIRVTKPDIICPVFLYYYSNWQPHVDYLRARANRGVQVNLSTGVIKGAKLLLPPLSQQKQIGEMLLSLDDRITLLRETNATLEAIAQALFKSWFVDFDPVRAKQQGREPENMDEATAALFPDSFEESELGLVPRGWRVVPFTETINVIGGGTPKTSISEYWNGDIPWFSVVDAPVITDVFVIDTEKHITQNGLDNSSTKLLPAGTTIISARGTVGRLALTGREMAMNQSCYGLRGKAGDDYFTYFCTYRLVETLRQRTHGSVFDTITRDTLTGVFVVYPEKTVISAFESLLTPIMERIRENLKQIQTLATLRDTLLPRIISGQLRLPEAEAMIEETA